MKRMLVILVLLFINTGAPVHAEENGKDCYPITGKDLIRKDAPRFDQYPAKIERIPHSTKVNLKSHTEARTYRTVLRTGAAEGPNFAGHYAVVGWGCGTSCLRFAVINLKSGKVIFPDEFTAVAQHHFDADEFEKDAGGSYWGLRYRLDSRLMIVVGGLNEEERREGAFYYLLKDDKLKRIFSVVVKKDNCGDRLKN